MVEIECHLSNSLPGIIIVGAGSRHVDEAKERLRGAFQSAKLEIPRKRITINLAPADIHKESSSLDLPIAVAILQSSGAVATTIDGSTAFIGELGLNGRLKPVRGIIGKIVAGQSNGFQRFYVPIDNLQQALMVPNVEIIPITNLRQLADILLGLTPALIQKGGGLHSTSETNSSSEALDAIIGQEHAKRALQIAAAGGHNLLLSGPPGAGKSMLAKVLASLLPPLSNEEILEVTHLHSLTDAQYDKLMTTRPVRTPHHSASHSAIVGGGGQIRPGEISLAHRGVLFLDELPEFKRDSLEALRQPLEDKTITISRARETVTFPADFIFIATANPCPCGYYNPANPAGGRTDQKLCDCSPSILNHYRHKLSGPLQDRIDLSITVESVDSSLLLAAPVKAQEEYDGASIKMLVLLARKRQQERYSSPVKLNNTMSNDEIKLQAKLTPEGVQLLNTAANTLHLSTRGYMRCIRVARTIADLSDSQQIETQHLTEALRYRIA